MEYSHQRRQRVRGATISISRRQVTRKSRASKKRSRNRPLHVHTCGNRTNITYRRFGWIGARNEDRATFSSSKEQTRPGYSRLEGGNRSSEQRTHNCASSVRGRRKQRRSICHALWNFSEPRARDDDDDKSDVVFRCLCCCCCCLLLLVLAFLGRAAPRAFASVLREGRWFVLRLRRAKMLIANFCAAWSVIRHFHLGVRFSISIRFYFYFRGYCVGILFRTNFMKHWCTRIIAESNNNFWRVYESLTMYNNSILVD